MVHRNLELSLSVVPAESDADGVVPRHPAVCRRETDGPGQVREDDVLVQLEHHYGVSLHRGPDHADHSSLLLPGSPAGQPDVGEEGRPPGPTLPDKQTAVKQ